MFHFPVPRCAFRGALYLFNTARRAEKNTCVMVIFVYSSIIEPLDTFKSTAAEIRIRPFIHLTFNVWETSVSQQSVLKQWQQLEFKHTDTLWNVTFVFGEQRAENCLWQLETQRQTNIIYNRPTLCFSCHLWQHTFVSSPESQFSTVWVYYRANQSQINHCNTGTGPLRWSPTSSWKILQITLFV